MPLFLSCVAVKIRGLCSVYIAFGANAATVFTFSSVQVLSVCITWGSNAAVFLPSVKTLCQQKIVKSLSHSSSVYTSCINFTVSAAVFFYWQQNFIALLCSFFTFIFESSNLRVVTKTTFTKIAVTWQWKVITRWNFDHWFRIDHRSRFAAWMRTAMSSSAIRSKLSYFWTTLIVYTLSSVIEFFGNFWRCFSIFEK